MASSTDSSWVIVRRKAPTSSRQASRSSSSTSSAMIFSWMVDQSQSWKRSERAPFSFITFMKLLVKRPVAGPMAR